MNTKTSPIIVIIAILCAFSAMNILPMVAGDSKSYTSFGGCTDPRQADLQYDSEALKKRQQLEKIVLSDARIQKILDNTSCEFMANGVLFTENGTYSTLNIDLNNTKQLTTLVSLQNSSVISYEIHDVFRSHSASVNPYSFIFPYLYAIGAGVAGIIVLLVVKRHRSKSSL